MKTAGIISIIVVILVIGLIGLILFNNINNSNIENPNTDNSNEVNDISGSTNEVDDFSGGQINDANNNPKTYTINIENYDYKPKTLEIKKGDIVIWMNKDSVRHTVTSDNGNELDSKLLADGETYSHTFNNVGEFNYHCKPHPYMKGVIMVINN